MDTGAASQRTVPSLPARTYSVIVPAYNEAELLPRLLRSIDVARLNFRGGADVIDVFVGNNASTDRTAEIAEGFGAHVIWVEKRVIAAARNGAARASSGDILCFIDADSELHPETFNEIENALYSGRCAVGASGIRMERMSLGIGAVLITGYFLTRLTRLDTGVVFCRREDFDAVGGYRENLFVAEDVDFMRRLKKRGHPRGARFMRLPRARALGSTRKFDRHGEWHYFSLAASLAVRSLFRDPRKSSFWDYWYNAR